MTTVQQHLEQAHQRIQAGEGTEIDQSFLDMMTNYGRVVLENKSLREALDKANATIAELNFQDDINQAVAASSPPASAVVDVNGVLAQYRLN